jgi:DNA mismatch endonuclease, patch repair protein
MSRIKSKNTSSELIVRKFLYKKGFRFRVNYRLEGKPDIIFPGRRIVVFINGCFWHKHGCDNSVMPKTNRKFWKNKLNGNVERDKKVQKILKKEGWTVYRIWECELEEKNSKTLNNLETFLKIKQ